MKKEKNNQMSKFKHFNPMALREKYSIGGTKKSDTPFSSFWADTDWDSRRSEFIDEDIVNILKLYNEEIMKIN